MKITHLFDYVLEDDNTETGGTAFDGETVRDDERLITKLEDIQLILSGMLRG